MMNAGSSASRPKTFVSVELSGDGLERLMKENEEPVEVVQIGPDRGSKPEPPKIPSADQRGLSRARSMG